VWESQIYWWASPYTPVAARILVNRRFKGDIMIVLRRWTIDEHDRVVSSDFTSSRSTHDPFQLKKELDSGDVSPTSIHSGISKVGNPLSSSRTYCRTTWPPLQASPRTKTVFPCHGCQRYFTSRNEVLWALHTSIVQSGTAAHEPWSGHSRSSAGRSYTSENAWTQSSERCVMQSLWLRRAAQPGNCLSRVSLDDPLIL